VRDQAAGPRQAAIRKAAQARRRLDLELGELRPQQRERMALQRQSERPVVGQRFLAFARRREGDGRLVDARGAQHLGRPRVDAGDRPRRLVPVPGDALQRVGLGEHRERVRVEAGASRQVLGAGERRFGT
jgi:hypothetical protein